ncbi:MAG: hypothetical protein ACRDJP_12625 [Actinomycetota bacterium]
MAVQVSRRTQEHLERRNAGDEPEWWLVLAVLGCLFAVVVCALAALAL